MATVQTVMNLSPEKRALIMREYPKGDLHALAAACGLKPSTLLTYAPKLGVHRDKRVQHDAVGASTRELYRRTRLRLKWGLDSITKRHLPLIKYNNRQNMTRFYMKKRGYILGDPTIQGERMTIFYDDDTVRAMHTEKTAVKHGFRIMRLEE